MMMFVFIRRTEKKRFIIKSMKNNINCFLANQSILKHTNSSTHVKKCRPIPVEKHRKSIRKMEAVVQLESLGIFPDKFRPFTGVFR